jgi:hypothetical protein
MKKSAISSRRCGADVPLESPFSKHFVAHFVGTNRVREMFDHEKLRVYGKALDFAAKASAWTSTWDKKHGMVDHLSRATESILLNLAEAARQRGTPPRLRIVDYAIGSSLESCLSGCLAIPVGRRCCAAAVFGPRSSAALP